MYSTCNGSNDEFGIDYGGLSIESKTIDHMNIFRRVKKNMIQNQFLSFLSQKLNTFGTCIVRSSYSMCS